MSVIATIDVAAEDFTLGGALAANPGIRIRLERVIPLGGTFVPYFWASDDSVEDIQATLRSEADIAAYRVVDRVNHEALVRVEWVEGMDGVLDALVDCHATILEAVGEDDTWTFQLRFDDHEQLTAFYRQCIERDIDVDLRSVHNPGFPADLGIGLGLTDTQRETLEAALESGYFEVPRRINLVDLADQLGVSDTAVSQRLRRGIANTLGATVSSVDDQ